MRQVWRILCAVAALALAAALAWPVAAQAPRTAEGLVAVPPLARVTDTAGVLSAADRAALDAKLAGFETAHGSQIAIVIVPSTQPEPIEDFANRVGSAWKIGRAGVGDGLLLVVATADRRVRIDVARSLEGAIPDVLAKRVIRETIAPRFAAGDYAGGLSAGLDRLFGLIEGEQLPAPAQRSERPAAGGQAVIGNLLPYLFVGVMVAALLRRIFGVPGAVVAGGGAGLLAGLLLSSLLLGAFAAVAVFLLALLFGSGFAGAALGGRGGFGGFGRGPWGGFGGGGFGGGGFGGGGGGGWSSGGGGDFSGGGASGGW